MRSGMSEAGRKPTGFELSIATLAAAAGLVSVAGCTGGSADRYSPAHHVTPALKTSEPTRPVVAKHELRCRPLDRSRWQRAGHVVHPVVISQIEGRLNITPNQVRYGAYGSARCDKPVHYDQVDSRIARVASIGADCLVVGIAPAGDPQLPLGRHEPLPVIQAVCPDLGE